MTASCRARESCRNGTVRGGPNQPARIRLAIPRRGFLAAAGGLAANLAFGASEQDLVRRAHALADTVFARLEPARGGIVSPLNLLDVFRPFATAALGDAAAALNWLYAGAGAGPGPLVEMDMLTKAISGQTGAGTTPALSHATALWLDRGAEPPSRPELAQNGLAGGTVESLALESPGALARINGWTSERTAGLIPMVIERIPAGSTAIVTTAMHFGARWGHGFDPALTGMGQFRRPGAEPVMVPFMRFVAPITLDLAEADGLLGVRLPYADPSFEFLMMMPQGRDDPNRVVAAARQGNLLTAAARLEFSPRPNVELLLPRLALSQSMDLLPILREGPLSAAFAQDAAFGPPFDGTPRISAVQSRTVLRFDEAGTVAAAASALAMERSMPLDGVTIRADVPFMAAVRHRDSGLIVIAALITDPGHE